ncbi:hypothetical protein [Pseudomonas nitroreducens]|uniref:hypothetical protein n=1 Tax=Pseudomonas nitroreducens TaxID=46680 RepID=UPI002D7E6CDF|nr:hypothetical protein [Pseudomonas nitroreducens]
MVEKVYTLLEKGDSEEFHLFEGEWTNKPEKRCSVALTSICKKMNKSDRKKVGGVNVKPYFACLEEDAARQSSARKGRAVCGICVSTLYTTPKD